MKDAHGGPPNEMQQKHNDLDAGLQAFKDALKPQEGQFNRAATLILNDPKDLSEKMGRNINGTTENSRIAHKMLDRNPDGTWRKPE